MKLHLSVLKENYAIHRYTAYSDIPNRMNESDFCSVTKTKDELSVVSRQSDSMPETTDVSQDWRILKIEGPLDLSSTGIIAEISGILAKNNIPIFTISTYNTDYILVKNQDLERAVHALEASGHKIIYEEQTH